MNRTGRLRAYVHDGVKAALCALAKAEDRTLSAYVARVLEHHIGQMDVGPDSPVTTDDVVVGFTYLIRCGVYYKIGRARDVGQRIAGMSLPEQPEIVAVASCGDYGDLEKALHVVFAHKRGHGEWFRLDDDDVHCAVHILRSRSVEKNLPTNVVDIAAIGRENTK
jgi:hypothetical protein